MKLSTLVNILRMGVVNTRKIVFFRSCSYFDKVLHKLKAINLIENYKDYKFLIGRGRFASVDFAWIKKKNNFYNKILKIINLDSKKKNIFVKSKEISKFLKKNNYDKNFIILLSTNSGIITHEEAISFGIGGKLILVIQVF